MQRRLQLIVAILETTLTFSWLGLGWLKEGLVPVLLPQERPLSLEGSNPGAILVAENLPKVEVLLFNSIHVVFSRNWTSKLGRLLPSIPRARKGCRGTL